MPATPEFSRHLAEMAFAGARVGLFRWPSREQIGDWRPYRPGETIAAPGGQWILRIESPDTGAWVESDVVLTFPGTEVQIPQVELTSH
jgi:hypothetical protein